MIETSLINAYTHYVSNYNLINYYAYRPREMLWGKRRSHLRSRPLTLKKEWMDFCVYAKFFFYQFPNGRYIILILLPWIKFYLTNYYEQSCIMDCIIFFRIFLFCFVFYTFFKMVLKGTCDGGNYYSIEHILNRAATGLIGSVFSS